MCSVQTLLAWMFEINSHTAEDLLTVFLSSVQSLNAIHGSFKSSSYTATFTATCDTTKSNVHLGVFCQAEKLNSGYHLTSANMGKELSIQIVCLSR